MCQNFWVFLNTYVNDESKKKKSKKFPFYCFIFRTESRIDCFVINTSPLRSDIEFISRKYWETLTYSLRSSILKDMTQMQDFLNTSTQALQSAAVMEEQYIDDASTKCEQIITDLVAVR